MNIIKRLDKAEIVIEKFDGKIATIGIKYNGKTFTGTAKVHPKDKNFSSEKVGKNIALLRAKINTLQYLRNQAVNEAKIKGQLLKEYSSCAQPDKKLINNVKNAQKRSESMSMALKFYKRKLKEYIWDLEKTFKYIKRIRDKVK